jgi:hypothetical protein
MASRRTADLPLHNGLAPAWLFRRMTDMAGAISTLVVRDAGPLELLRRLSDPFWFQAFGCVLGFDWHSSGVTTTVCGALKEAARKYGGDMGVVVCGGKGATSRKAPDDIRRACERTGDPADVLVYASRLAAKVDNTAVQDGYQLYHHSFLFAPGSGTWCVVQQGMNAQARYARRYHWLSESMPSFVSEPHAAVACDRRASVLNLVAGEGNKHRQAVTALSREHPEKLLREIRPLLNEPDMPLFAALLALEDAAPERRVGTAHRIGGRCPPYPRSADLRMPSPHALSEKDLDPSTVKKVLLKTYERQAADFEQLLGEPGLGPKALRSLSLIAEIIYRAPASRRDPAAYSFAHGGKDGHPYPVNRALYDANLERLRAAIGAAKIGRTDQIEALKALAKFTARLAKA